MRGASPVATVCRMGDTVIGAGGRSGPAIVLRALLVLGLAGCSGFGGGGEPVPPAVLSAASVDLLEPFRVERQVVADRVDLVLTPNFYDQLWLPGIAPERSVSPRGDVYVYRTDIDRPLDLRLEQTRFVIIDTLRVTVLTGRPELTLTAEAGGHVTVIADGERQACEVVRVEAGQWTSR